MSTATAVSAVLRIPIESVRPGPNARGEVGDVTELAVSLLNLGQQNPVQVTDLHDGTYQLLDGHRRYAAARQAGLSTLDAVVRGDCPPSVRLLRQLAMHAQGKAFDPIAEAKSCHALMWEHNLTREQIAVSIGKSPGWVRDRIGLLQLRPDEQRDIAAGRMTLAEARGILAQRRAERDGHPSRSRIAITTRTTAKVPNHCPTCTCGKPARPRDDTCGRRECVAVAIDLDTAAARREDH